MGRRVASLLEVDGTSIDGDLRQGWSSRWVGGGSANGQKRRLEGKKERIEILTDKFVS